MKCARVLQNKAMIIIYANSLGKFLEYRCSVYSYNEILLEHLILELGWVFSDQYFYILQEKFLIFFVLSKTQMIHYPEISVEVTNVMKRLGKFIDTRLSLPENSKTFSLKTSKTIVFLHKFQHVLRRLSLLSTCLSIVQPLLDFRAIKYLIN